MAKTARDLTVSKLSIEEINFDALKRLKAISNKEFDELPKETKEKLSVLYNQSMVIWNDPKKLRDLSGAEIVELLEPYKTRSFKTFPAFLKDDLLNLYKRGVNNPKMTKLLLWFIDKRDFAPGELPKEMQDFLEYAYAQNCYDYDIDSFATLVGGIRKFLYRDLSENQKAFMRVAFARDIDDMTNEQLYVLVNYVKNASKLGVEYNKMPESMQDFVLGCYKRCVVKTETSANNLKMTGSWIKNGYDTTQCYQCFAAFNRAFAGLDKIDRAMYFQNPAKKLNLLNLINYANLQHGYIGNGSLNNFYGDDVYQRANEIAGELNLPKIYALYHQAYHFDKDVLLPYSQKEAYYLDDAEGILMSEQTDEYGNPLRVYHIETTREYKDRVAVPLSDTFDGMVDYFVRIASKDFMEDNITPEEQAKVADKLIAVFDGDITHHGQAMIESIVNQGSIKREIFVTNAKNTMDDLMNVDAMKQILASKNKAKEKAQKDLEDQLLSYTPEELDAWVETASPKELKVYYSLFETESTPRRNSSDYCDPWELSEKELESQIADLQKQLSDRRLSEKARNDLKLKLQDSMWVLHDSDKFERD